MTSREQKETPDTDVELTTEELRLIGKRIASWLDAQAAAPTAVPLEAREWLNDVPAFSDADEALVDLMSAVPIEDRDWHKKRIARLLESYSSHVNAALTAQVERLGAQVIKHEEREAAACPEDVGFEEVIRILRRTLQAAESRISELERERDEARELVDGLRIMYEAEARVHNRTYELWTTAESQLSTTQEALRKIWAVIDAPMDKGGDWEQQYWTRLRKVRGIVEAERVLSPPTKKVGD